MLKILNAQKIYLLELFKVLSTVPKQTSPHYFLNDAINIFELEKLLNGEARKTEHKLFVKLTTKKMTTNASALDILCFAKLDIKIMKKYLYPKQNFQIFYIDLGKIVHTRKLIPFKAVLVGDSFSGYASFCSMYLQKHITRQVPAYLNVCQTLILLMHNTFYTAYGNSYVI